MASQLDYLYKKDLVAYQNDYKDPQHRCLLAGHCLTDLGIETVKHYFPKYQSVWHHTPTPLTILKQ